MTAAIEQAAWERRSFDGHQAGSRRDSKRWMPTVRTVPALDRRVAAAMAPPVAVGEIVRTPLVPEQGVAGRLVATAGSLLLHAVFLALLLAWSPPDHEDIGADAVAIEIVMDPGEAPIETVAGVMASAAAETAPEPRPRDEAPSPLETTSLDETSPPTSLPDPPIAAAYPPLETVPDEEPSPMMEAEPAIVLPPTLISPVAAEDAIPPPPPAPVPTTSADPVPTPPKETRHASPSPEKPKPRTPDPRRVRPEAPAKPSTVKAAPRGNADTTRSAGASYGQSYVAVASGATLSSWRAAVLAALARAKRYPDAALERGLEGRGTITFVVDRSGRVGRVALVSPTGLPMLDAAALAMPHRANFPAMPPGGPATETFTARVVFDIN